MTEFSEEIKGAGLCASCKYLKLIYNERGSRFVMCLLSKTNAAFPKYPALPVLSCAGYRLNTKTENGTKDR